MYAKKETVFPKKPRVYFISLGANIIETNYWDSWIGEYHIVSFRLEAMRLLLPEKSQADVFLMQQDPKRVEVSLLDDDLWAPGKSCLKWAVFDQEDEFIWGCQIAAPQIVDRQCISVGDVERIASVWVKGARGPEKALELPASFRKVREIPDFPQI